ncbi:carboxyltransferase domain-containing protein [Paenarthrobacter sp. CCNWLY172]|uniref:carboxyltransferase domain-containing protein n=1 Tax=unclassified Paenarthrobacter TaxID=2634190 RepID=UPI003077DD57
MVNPDGMAFIACQPGTLLVEILAPAFSAPPVEEFVEAVQSLELCGIVGLKKMKDGVLLTYDERSMRVQDLRPILAAAYSKVAYDAGDYCPRTHTLPITFGGPAGPDLAVACVLFDTTERTLIRRLCRSKRTIKMFAAPGASALLEIPLSDDGLQAFQASRSKRAAPPGSLLLSGAGLTITSRESYSDECRIGGVSYGAGSAIDAFHLGDSVWLRGHHASRSKANDR